MQITKLDHVNLRTTRLDEMIAWYRDILGLSQGMRPDFPFPGAWMYAGDAAVVHLVGVDEAGASGTDAALKMEHVAFRAEDAATFEERLKQRGIGYRRVEIDQTDTVAFNVWDPDGNHLHVDFDRKM